MKRITIVTSLALQIAFCANAQKNSTNLTLGDLQQLTATADEMYILNYQSANDADYVDFNFAQNNSTNMNYYGRKNSSSTALLTSGIVLAGVGTVTFACGVLYPLYALVSTSGYGSPNDNDEKGKVKVIMGVGIGVATIGVILITVGADMKRLHRYSLISPKPNEIGFAYNF